MQAVGAIIDGGVGADDMSDWLVDRHVRAGRGDHVALRERDRAVSYRELATLVARTGDALATFGVEPGARVMLVMLDSVEMVAAFLGALRIGAVPLPVNPLLGGAELGVVACDADAQRGDRVRRARRPRGGAPRRGARSHADRADRRGRPTPGPAQPGTIRWSDLLAAAQPSMADSPAPSAAGYWLCTGGTTGRPKLAMHQAADLRTIWETYGRHVLGVRPDDRLYSVGPMFHAYGLGNSLALPLAAGATAVLEPTRPPTPERVGRTVTEQRPTILFSVPTSYAALVGSDLPADVFASVRIAVSAGETLPPALFERVRERFGLELLDGIGSTELGHIFLSNRPGTARGGSCGTPVPGFRVRLLDDDGREVGPDVPADLWVAGPSAATGYWQLPERTAATFVDGWVRTGDTYRRTAHGDYCFVGRTDELFKVGGEWVSPYEVEAVLLEHPNVEAAAVVAGSTAAGTLQTVAFVVTRDGAGCEPDGLVEHCTRRLAGFKRPRQWRFVPELPKTAAGKVRRNVLARAGEGRVRMTADHRNEGGVLERFRLDGQVALVTGSSRGIGASIAVALAEAGADVALVARNAASLAEVARAVHAAGRRAEPIVCDVTEGDQSIAAVAHALRALGRIDILVNNAGGPMFNASFLDTRESGWRKVLDLNLNSVVHFCREVGRHMIERRSGSVINVTSPATIRPWPAITAYGSAKAAVLNLTQALAQEWAADGVRVNAICPGWI